MNSSSNFTFTPNLTQPSLSTPSNYAFNIQNKQTIAIPQMIIEEMQSRISNYENSILNLELRLSNIETKIPDKVVDDHSMVKDDITIKNIIKIQMTNDLKAEVAQFPLLKVVHDACIQESRHFGDDVLNSLKEFETVWTLPGKKFSNGEHCESVMRFSVKRIP
mmetsp:Transcript_7175/g.6440  ORF Transcript_7175/g.6440 Transcript_7175/m.6440 type:complete len:163 (+) Transcript_7175:45-533(+)